MIFSYKNYFHNETKIDTANILLISILPLALISGSAIINTLLILICIFFLITLFIKKKLFFFYNKIFYLFIFFWISLIINLFFTTNLESSFLRVFGFGKFILLVFSIKFYLEYKNNIYEKFIYKNWFIIFSIVTIDLLFEFVFGFNSLGYKSYMPGRLAGFLNDELKIGHYYSAFCLISVSYIYYNHKKKFLTYICGLLFIFISFAIGERSNFIKTFIIFMMFFITFEQKKNFRKFIFFFIGSILIILLVFQRDEIKTRFWYQFLLPIKNNSTIYEYIHKTQYGAHYDTAIKIFYNYPIFGSGLKTYRYESSKLIYKSGDDSVDDKRWATHPHQVHFEFLSETGIFGYLSFVAFILSSIILGIKSYLKNRNIYKLSSIFFICISILPLLPSGSFFTTYGATIFWINFGIMISCNKKITN